MSQRGSTGPVHHRSVSRDRDGTHCPLEGSDAAQAPPDQAPQATLGGCKGFNQITCKVCEDTFSSHALKVPRLLSCGHTLCEHCLLKLVEDAHVICPFDRQPTLVPSTGVRGLNKNFSLLELVESLQHCTVSEVCSGSAATDLPTPCDENETHAATVYCLTCATHLCASCASSVHSTKTLLRHKMVPLSEKPRPRPQCALHPGHHIELVCLETDCQAQPIMCYLCRDFSAHRGHKFNIISYEADSIRALISDCTALVRRFADDLSESICRISLCLQQLGGNCFSARSHSTPPPPLHSSTPPVDEHEHSNGESMPLGTPSSSAASSSCTPRGSAYIARIQVREYFEELHHTLRRQEEVALSVINTYVRERKVGLQTEIESMTLVLSRITCLEADLQRRLTQDEAALVLAKPDILQAFETIKSQQSHFMETHTSLHLDPSIPVTFTKDNRVHIGPKIEMRLVMLGLNNAGKTSILFKLKQNEFVATIPTIGFNVETVEFKNLQFNIWDVGGDPKLRPLWKHYYLNTQALIFVVDSGDRSRLLEAHTELSKLILEKDLRDAILLVFASKQDNRHALGVEILTEELNLHKLCCGRRWHIQACDAQTGVGLEDGLDWLSRQLVWAGVIDVV